MQYGIPGIMRDGYCNIIHGYYIKPGKYSNIEGKCR